ncbi:ABC transporter ATP-binding protein [Roseiflexus sp.]|uniref:ABC transporter ATP-binding protein n=1 Tax=Roseiflexus sp. TaxID=2562120 RepID=UPI0021DD55FD|nr:ABC transporter ATP-binding protein [Roseiflexus sp.]GIW00205.1 MAG: ABC transporter [Roseiflexus sp.]
MDQFHRLWPFVRRYRRRLLIGALCALAATAVAAMIPQIVRFAVDDLNTRGVVIERLLRYGGLLLLAALVEGLLRYGQRTQIIGTSHLIDFDMREALFARLLTLDQGFFTTMHTGDLMTRVTNDLSAVRMFLGPGISNLLGSTLLLLTAATLMFLTNPALAAIVVLLLPMAAVLFVVIGGRMRAIFRKVQDQFGEISTRAQENFSGIRTIKAYAQEDAEIRVFRQANERYRALNLRYVLLSGMLWPIIGLMLGTIGAFVLLIGGRMVAAGEMTVGELVLFNAYLAQLAWPVIALGWTVDLYQQGAASLVRIGEVLQRRPAIASPPDAPRDFVVRGEVEFRNVGLRFAHSQHTNGDASGHHANAPSTSGKPAASGAPEWVLRHISFRIPQGGSLGIVGATGAGKTTLVNLLARVRDPDEGQVLVDGYDVRTLPLDALRRGIGYVPQDTFLFSVPIRENVTFGRPDATEDQIIHALAVSRLINDVEQFPDGIDTLIGERGVTLSGGQKQRTAIARAILRDPAILILDDALSSVDTHTAAEILASLRAMMKGRTCMIIAQRIATVKDADQIIVLHNGEIIERGTHRELVEGSGRYADMYRRELLRAELEEE